MRRIATDQGLSVSAILLCYDCEEFVAEALRSVLSQEQVSLEILVSDDASHDRTFEIVQKETARYDGPHRVAVRQRSVNSGSKAAHLNDVFARVSGDVVVLFDGDDISSGHRVRRILQAFESSGEVQAVYSAMLLIDRFGKPLGTPRVPHPPSNVNTKGWFAKVDAYAAGGTLAVRRPVLETFGDLDDAVHEDVALPFRASLLGEVDYLAEPLVKARRHAASWTTRLDQYESVPAFRSRMHQGIARAKHRAASRLADLAVAERLSPDRVRTLGALHAVVARSLCEAELTANLINSSLTVRVLTLLRLLRAGAYPEQFWQHLFLALSPAMYVRYKRRTMARGVS